VGAVRSIEIVEAFPGSQFLPEIHSVAIGEQPGELLPVGSMGSLDLAIELRRARSDVDVFHAEFRHRHLIQLT
jgi:hypothetical protein